MCSPQWPGLLPRRDRSGLPPQGFVTGGKHPSDLPLFRWINTFLGNLKTSFWGTFHAFNIDKYAWRYQGSFCFRSHRRFSMVEMTDRIANAFCFCIARTERDLRFAEVCG